MSTSTVSMDNLDWTIQLACPASAGTNKVKEILNRGITSYVWDEISAKIHPVNDVIETRKNILLYYLRNQVPVSSIQHMRHTKRLKEERKIVASNIESKQAECIQIDTSIREKGFKLANLLSVKKSIQLKKDALELKCQETKAEINNFDKMFSICETLMPPIKNNIDEQIMNESLMHVGAISSRADKREALKQLSQNLGNVAIGELWSWILNKRIHDTEKLVNHGIHNDMKMSKKQHRQRLSVGIAKVCGQHMISTIAKITHLKKGDEERTRGINYMEKIENIMGNDNEAMQDWLIMAVEVSQLEKSQKIMESEIDMMKIVTADAVQFHDRHLQLASEIHEINVHTEQCADKIQQALMKFEPASQSLKIFRNQLASALNTIAALNSQYSVEWLENNLSEEIEVFQESLNINALHKVLLSGKIGAYRHASTCMSNAVHASPAFTSSSPVYRVPLYYLIDCFSNLIANDVLKSQKEEQNIVEQLEMNSKIISTPSTRETDILKLLYETQLLCEKCQKEIKNFDSIYDSWVYQSVNEVMAINEDTVYGATYNEWIQRFTTLVYMLQRNK